MTLPKYRACIQNYRLSKATFLAMLGDPVQPVVLDANSPTTRWGKKIDYGTQNTSSDSTTRAFFEKIPDDNWAIVSFDPETRTVCVDITDESTTTTSKTMSVILPPLT